MKPAQTRPKRSKNVDWQDIHRRLAAVRDAVDRGQSPAPEESRRILKTRAEALAHEPADGAMGSQAIEVIVFLLAQEKYCVESSFVREVYPMKDLTPLPCTPRHVLGIVNVRGQILSVIDIKKFFDLPEKGLTDLNKVIILRSDDMTFGILADEILGVRSLTMAEIQPALPTLTGVREAYLKGVTRDRMVVLDAEKLLSDTKIVVHETVEA